jgi:hypothetical protein
MSNHRLIGSKGYALGGSRAEPWALLPSLVPPGPETDMRSLHYHVLIEVSDGGRGGQCLW